MLRLLSTLLVAIIIGGLLYLIYMNPGWHQFVIAPGKVLEVPLMGTVLAGFFLGGATFILVFFFMTVEGFWGALKKNAADKRTRRVSVLYELALEKLMVGSRYEAEKLFYKALGINPDHIPTLVILGKMRREDGALTDAIELHSKAKGLDSQNPAALLELAEDYIKSEQFVNAVSTLKEVRGLAATALPPMEKLRDVYVRVNNLSEAIKVQRKVVDYSLAANERQERKKLTALMYEEAVGLLDNNRLDEARGLLKSAISEDAQFIPAYLKLAEAHEFSGAPSNAKKALEWGFKSTHSLIPLKALEIYLMAKGEKNSVLEYYKWAVGLAPSNDALRILLAGAYLDTGDKESSLAELGKLKGQLASSPLRHIMELKISYMSNGSGESEAAKGAEKAYESAMKEFFHFICSTCGEISPNYAGRCPSCGEWNGIRPLMY